MEIKHIKDAADLDGITLTFAVRKVSKDEKTTYVSDVKITTADWKTAQLKNVSLRDALSCFGQTVLSAADMECIDRYIFEYNKTCLARNGSFISLDTPGYLSYEIPPKNSKSKKAFHLHTFSGHVRYGSIDELYSDAKMNDENKSYEKAMQSLMSKVNIR